MKRAVLILTAALLTSVALCACSNGGSNTSSEPSNSSVVSQPSAEESKVSSESSENTSSTESSLLKDTYTKIQEQVTLPEMVNLDTTKKLDRYYGIQAEDVEDYAGGINNSGVQQDEIVLIKATSEDAAQRIVDALQARYDAKISENENYNPEQAAMIKACKIEQDGLYVSMIISPDAEKITDIYKTAIQ